MALEEVGVKLILEGEGVFSSALGNATKAVDQLGNTAKSSLGGLEAAARPLDTVAAKAAAAGLKWDEAAGRWRTATGQYASGAAIAAAGLDDFSDRSTKATKKATDGLDDFADRSVKATKKAGSGFSSLEQIAIGGLRRIGEAAINAMGQAAMAVAGFAQQSVSAAGEFEDGMNQFAAAAGGSLEAAGLEVDDFKQLFLSLGAELPVSTKEVQDAAIALVKGGIDPAIVAAGGLESSLQFAAAAGMGLEEAAELGVKMLGTFTSITDDAATKTAFLAESQDLLVKAAGASTLNVEQLGDAMLEAGGQAKAIGLDYQEFVTTMGLISPAFKSAATAGTSFKNMLVRLQPSTAPAKEAMADLGLMTTSTAKIMDFLRTQGIEPLGSDLDTLGNQFTEFAASQGWTQKEIAKTWETFSQSVFFDEVTGEFIGMEAATQKLQDAFLGLSDAQRIQAMQAIFGNDAMGAANALVDAGAAGYQEFVQKMLEANGVMAQSAAVQQGLDFQMTQFQGSVESLQISLGLLLIPALTQLFEHVLVPGVNVLNSIVGAISGSRDAFDSLPGPIQALLAPFLGLSGALNSTSEAVRNTAAPVLSLQNVLSGLPEPIAGAVAVIQNLIGAFMGDQEAMNRLPGTIRTLVEVAMGVPAAIESARQAIDAFFNTPLGTALTDAAGAFGSYMLNDFGPNVAGAFSTTRAKVDEFFNTPLGQELQQGAGVVASYFANDFAREVSQGIGVVESGLNRLGSSNFGRELQQGAGVVADFMENEFPGRFQRGLDLVMGAIEPWTTEAGRNWEAGMKAAGIFADYMLNEWPAQFQRGIENVGQFFEDFKNQLLSIGPDFGTASKSIGTAIIDGIIAGLDAASGGLFSSIRGIIQSALGSAEKEAEVGSPSRLFAREIGRPITEGVAQGILQAAPTAVGATKQLGAALLQGMGGILEGGFTLREFSADLGLSAVDDLTGAVEDQKPGAIGTAADFGEAIIGGISRGIRDKAHEAAQAAEDAANAALDAIGKALQIGSPSQVFADQVGAPISQGIAQGIGAEAQAIFLATEEIPPKIVEVFEDGSIAINEAAAKEIGLPITEGLAEGVLLGIDKFIKPAIDELGEDAIRQLEGIANQMGRLIDESLSGQVGMIRIQSSGIDIIRKMYDEFYEMDKEAFDRQEELKEAQEALSKGITTAAERTADIEASRQKATATATERMRQIESEGARKLADLEAERERSSEEFIRKMIALDEERAQAKTPEKVAEIERKMADLMRDDQKREEDYQRKLADQRMATEKGVGAEREKVAEAERKAQQDIAAIQQQAVAEEEKLRKRISVLQNETPDSQRERIAQLQKIQEIEAQLDEVNTEAARIGAIDPKAGAEYMAVRQRQIGEILDLEQALSRAQRTVERETLQTQLDLAKRRHAVELEQLQNSMGKRAQELAGLGEEFKETGNSLVDGMIQGMRDRASEMATALREILMAALAGAQEQLGITSPSLVFAQQVGMPIAEGVAMGVNAAMPVALGAVNDMAQSLVRPAAPAMARGGTSNSTVVNNFNYSPQYQGAPRQPSQDFASMRVLSTAR